MFQYSNDYIKSQYSGPYTSFKKIDFYREDICGISSENVEMKYCERVKSSVRKNNILLS